MLPLRVTDGIHGVQLSEGLRSFRPRAQQLRPSHQDSGLQGGGLLASSPSFALRSVESATNNSTAEGEAIGSANRVASLTAAASPNTAKNVLSPLSGSAPIADSRKRMSPSASDAGGSSGSPPGLAAVATTAPAPSLLPIESAQPSMSSFDSSRLRVDATSHMPSSPPCTTSEPRERGKKFEWKVRPTKLASASAASQISAKASSPVPFGLVAAGEAATSLHATDASGNANNSTGDAATAGAAAAAARGRPPRSESKPSSMPQSRIDAAVTTTRGSSGNKNMDASTKPPLSGRKESSAASGSVTLPAPPLISSYRRQQEQGDDESESTIVHGVDVGSDPATTTPEAEYFRRRRAHAALTSDVVVPSNTRLPQTWQELLASVSSYQATQLRVALLPVGTRVRRADFVNAFFRALRSVVFTKFRTRLEPLVGDLFDARDTDHDGLICFEDLPLHEALLRAGGVDADAHTFQRPTALQLEMDSRELLVALDEDPKRVRTICVAGTSDIYRLAEVIKAGGSADDFEAEGRRTSSPQAMRQRRRDLASSPAHADGGANPPRLTASELRRWRLQRKAALAVSQSETALATQPNARRHKTATPTNDDCGGGADDGADDSDAEDTFETPQAGPRSIGGGGVSSLGKLADSLGLPEGSASQQKRAAMEQMRAAAKNAAPHHRLRTYLRRAAFSFSQCSAIAAHPTFGATVHSAVCGSDVLIFRVVAASQLADAYVRRANDQAQQRAAEQHRPFTPADGDKGVTASGKLDKLNQQHVVPVHLDGYVIELMEVLQHGHLAAVTVVVDVPQTRTLYTAGADRTLVPWAPVSAAGSGARDETATPEWLPLRLPVDTVAPALFLTYDATAFNLIAGCADGCIRLFPVVPILGCCSRSVRAHAPGTLSGLSVCHVGAMEGIATCATDGVVRMWRRQELELISEKCLYVDETSHAPGVGAGAALSPTPAAVAISDPSQVPDTARPSTAGTTTSGSTVSVTHATAAAPHARATGGDHHVRHTAAATALHLAAGTRTALVTATPDNTAMCTLAGVGRALALWSPFLPEPTELLSGGHERGVVSLIVPRRYDTTVYDAASASVSKQEIFEWYNNHARRGSQTIISVDGGGRVCVWDLRRAMLSQSFGGPADASTPIGPVRSACWCEGLSGLLLLGSDGLTLVTPQWGSAAAVAATAGGHGAAAQGGDGIAASSAAVGQTNEVTGRSAFDAPIQALAFAAATQQLYAATGSMILCLDAVSGAIQSHSRVAAPHELQSLTLVDRADLRLLAAGTPEGRVMVIHHGVTWSVLCCIEAGGPLLLVRDLGTSARFRPFLPNAPNGTIVTKGNTLVDERVGGGARSGAGAAKDAAGKAATSTASSSSSKHTPFTGTSHYHHGAWTDATNSTRISRILCVTHTGAVVHFAAPLPSVHRLTLGGMTTPTPARPTAFAATGGNGLFLPGAVDTTFTTDEVALSAVRGDIIAPTVAGKNCKVCNGCTYSGALGLTYLACGGGVFGFDVAHRVRKRPWIVLPDVAAGADDDAVVADQPDVEASVRRQSIDMQLAGTADDDISQLAAAWFDRGSRISCITCADPAETVFIAVTGARGDVWVAARHYLTGAPLYRVTVAMPRPVRESRSAMAGGRWGADVVGGGGASAGFSGSSSAVVSARHSHTTPFVGALRITGGAYSPNRSLGGPPPVLAMTPAGASSVSPPNLSMASQPNPNGGGGPSFDIAAAALVAAAGRYPSLQQLLHGVTTSHPSSTGYLNARAGANARAAAPPVRTRPSRRHHIDSLRPAALCFDPVGWTLWAAPGSRSACTIDLRAAGRLLIEAQRAGATAAVSDVYTKLIGGARYAAVVHAHGLHAAGDAGDAGGAGDASLGSNMTAGTGGHVGDAPLSPTSPFSGRGSVSSAYEGSVTASGTRRNTAVTVEEANNVGAFFIRGPASAPLAMPQAGTRPDRTKNLQPGADGGAGGANGVQAALFSRRARVLLFECRANYGFKPSGVGSMTPAGEAPPPASPTSSGLSPPAMSAGPAAPAATVARSSALGLPISPVLTLVVSFAATAERTRGVAATAVLQRIRRIQRLQYAAALDAWAHDAVTAAGAATASSLQGGASSAQGTTIGANNSIVGRFESPTAPGTAGATARASLASPTLIHHAAPTPSDPTNSGQSGVVAGRRPYVSVKEQQRLQAEKAANDALARVQAFEQNARDAAAWLWWVRRERQCRGSIPALSGGCPSVSTDFTSPSPAAAVQNTGRSSSTSRDVRSLSRSHGPGIVNAGLGGSSSPGTHGLTRRATSVSTAAPGLGAEGRGGTAADSAWLQQKRGIPGATVLPNIVFVHDAFAPPLHEHVLDSSEARATPAALLAAAAFKERGSKARTATAGGVKPTTGGALGGADSITGPRSTLLYLVTEHVEPIAVLPRIQSASPDFTPASVAATSAAPGGSANGGSGSVANTTSANAKADTAAMVAPALSRAREVLGPQEAVLELRWLIACLARALRGLFAAGLSTVFDVATDVRLQHDTFVLVPRHGAWRLPGTKPTARARRASEAALQQKHQPPSWMRPARSAAASPATSPQGSPQRRHTNLWSRRGTLVGADGDGALPSSDGGSNAVASIPDPRRFLLVADVESLLPLESSEPADTTDSEADGDAAAASPSPSQSPLRHQMLPPPSALLPGGAPMSGGLLSADLSIQRVESVYPAGPAHAMESRADTLDLTRGTSTASPIALGSAIMDCGSPLQLTRGGHHPAVASSAFAAGAAPHLRGGDGPLAIHSGATTPTSAMAQPGSPTTTTAPATRPGTAAGDAISRPGTSEQGGATGGSDAVAATLALLGGDQPADTLKVTLRDRVLRSKEALKEMSLRLKRHGHGSRRYQHQGIEEIARMVPLSRRPPEGIDNAYGVPTPAACMWWLGLALLEVALGRPVFQTIIHEPTAPVESSSPRGGGLRGAASPRSASSPLARSGASPRAASGGISAKDTHNHVSHTPTEPALALLAPELADALRAAMVPPFRDVVWLPECLRGLLQPEPARRWTPEQVLSCIESPALPPRHMRCVVPAASSADAPIELPVTEWPSMRVAEAAAGGRPLSRAAQTPRGPSGASRAAAAEHRLMRYNGVALPGLDVLSAFAAPVLGPGAAVSACAPAHTPTAFIVTAEVRGDARREGFAGDSDADSSQGSPPRAAASRGDGRRSGSRRSEASDDSGADLEDGIDEAGLGGGAANMIVLRRPDGSVAGTVPPAAEVCPVWSPGTVVASDRDTDAASQRGAGASPAAKAAAAKAARSSGRSEEAGRGASPGAVGITAGRAPGANTVVPGFGGQPVALSVLAALSEEGTATTLDGANTLNGGADGRGAGSDASRGAGAGGAGGGGGALGTTELQRILQTSRNRIAERMYFSKTRKSAPQLPPLPPRDDRAALAQEAAALWATRAAPFYAALHPSLLGAAALPTDATGGGSAQPSTGGPSGPSPALEAMSQERRESFIDVPFYLDGGAWVRRAQHSPLRVGALGHSRAAAAHLAATGDDTTTHGVVGTRAKSPQQQQRPQSVSPSFGRRRSPSATRAVPLTPVSVTPTPGSRPPATTPLPLIGSRGSREAHVANGIGAPRSPSLQQQQRRAAAPSVRSGPSMSPSGFDDFGRRAVVNQALTDEVSPEEAAEREADIATATRAVMREALGRNYIGTDRMRRLETRAADARQAAHVGLAAMLQSMDDRARVHQRQHRERLHLERYGAAESTGGESGDDATAAGANVGTSDVPSAFGATSAAMATGAALLRGAPVAPEVARAAASRMLDRIIRATGPDQQPQQQQGRRLSAGVGVAAAAGSAGPTPTTANTVGTRLALQEVRGADLSREERERIVRDAGREYIDRRLRRHLG